MAFLAPVVTLVASIRLNLVVQRVRNCYIICFVLRLRNCGLQSVLTSCKEKGLEGQANDVAGTPRSRGHWIKCKAVLLRQLNSKLAETGVILCVIVPSEVADSVR